MSCSTRITVRSLESLIFGESMQDKKSWNPKNTLVLRSKHTEEGSEAGAGVTWGTPYSKVRGAVVGVLLHPEAQWDPSVRILDYREKR